MRGEAEGRMLTKPLILDGTELHLNVNANQGYVTVAITDDIGTPLENYTSQQIVGDQLDAKVEFSRSLEAIKAKRSGSNSNSDEQVSILTGSLRPDPSCY